MKYARLMLPMALIGVIGCSNQKVNIDVENPSQEASAQMVSFDVRPLVKRLGTAQLVVNDAKGNALASQITSDSMLIFRAVLEPGKNAFTVEPGSIEVAPTSVGSIRADRMDDLAWENDLVAFRAYGPALQRSGERGFGYDIFTKRDTSEPYLDDLYNREHDGNWWGKIAEYKAQGNLEAADSVFRHHSYHMDHGNGMDCFAVGPTLGAGATALVDANGDIVYPWCWAECDIVDNGPLRFRAILTFQPTVVDGDTIVEVRDITLDAGDYFNKTIIRYEGANAEHLLVAGVPLRDDSPMEADPNGMYLIYDNPTLQATSDYNEDQGRIYQGLVFVQPSDSIATRVDGDKTHLVGYKQYAPGQEYEYYWGFGWSHAGVDADQWKRIVEQRSTQVQNPLIVTLQEQ